MNSTHAAWLAFAAAITTAVIPVVAAAPLPPWVTPILLAASAGLHAYLPDAPPGAGLTGGKS